MSTEAPTNTTVQIVAQEAENLDTICYRGSAPLADLAVISQADVFDQVANPSGLQRDLSPKHASEAYAYVARQRDPEFPRAFPEVILNVRDEDIVSVERIPGSRQDRNGPRNFRFTFDLDAIMERHPEVIVSRVDGNHRLYYAAGDDRHDEVRSEVPFQLHVGLAPDQEANLFVDVNANQKGLNSSHLHILRSRLTPDEVELRDHPERVFATRLSEDEESPWFGMVHLGGSRRGSREQNVVRPISFVALEQGVRRTLVKSQYIHDLTNPDAQYVLIRNYWAAVKQVFGYEWENPRDFLLLKNLGVQALSIFGGTVIDRCMARGEVDVASMRAYVDQSKSRFDWSRDATGEKSVVGMSGNRAALIIAGELATELVDLGDNEAVRRVQDQLLDIADDSRLASEARQARERVEERQAAPEPDVDELVAAGVHRSSEPVGAGDDE